MLVFGVSAVVGCFSLLDMMFKVFGGFWLFCGLCCFKVIVFVMLIVLS